MLTYRPADSLKILLLVTLLTGCSSPAPQYNGPVSIGIITKSMGFPTVVRKNQTYILAVQARIYEGDIVKTDNGSMLNIQMSDETVFLLGSNSHFVLHSYKYTPHSWAPIARLSLTNGTLRTTTGNIMKKKRTSFEIKTTLAVIDVVSGDFWVGYLGENTLEVALADGAGIYVFNDSGSVNIDNAGYGTSIIGDSAPQTPTIWTEQDLNAVFSTLTF